MTTKISLTDTAKAYLAEVANWLEAGAPHETRHGLQIDGFDMDVGVTDPQANCGAVCCIAGALVQFNQPFHETHLAGATELKWEEVRDRAMVLLGLPDDEVGKAAAEQLFRSIPNNDWITPAIAAQVLRHLIAYEEVDWQQFRPGKEANS